MSLQLAWWSRLRRALGTTAIWSAGLSATVLGPIGCASAPRPATNVGFDSRPLEAPKSAWAQSSRQSAPAAKPTGPQSHSAAKPAEDDGPIVLPMPEIVQTSQVVLEAPPVLQSVGPEPVMAPLAMPMDVGATVVADEGYAGGPVMAEGAACANGKCGCNPQGMCGIPGNEAAACKTKYTKDERLSFKSMLCGVRSPKADNLANANRRDIGSNNPCFPREMRLKSHPLYIVEPPDVLYIEALQLLPNRPVAGERLVRQDGTISLGYYGQLHVAGLTLAEIEQKLRDRLGEYVNDPQVFIDVASFNSKVYYVLGQVQQTGRLPITGKETVIDAITLAGGITNFADARYMHVARPNPGGGCDQILHVDWKAISDCGDTRTNYQLLPGDRVVVPATKGFKATVALENYLTPLSQIVNTFSIFRFATQ